MKTWVRKSIKVGVLAAGFLLATGPNAQAAEIISVDNDGVLAGNQVAVPIQAPINVCGNGIGALVGYGAGQGQCDAIAISEEPGKKTYAESDQQRRVTKYQPRHAAPERHSGDVLVSADNDGVLTGNQVYLPIQAPINVCGNGIGALLGFGAGQGDCTGVAVREDGTVTAVSTGNDGVLAGNQVVIPVQLPINVCGNGIGALLGAGAGQAQCTAVAVSGVDKEKPKDPYESAHATELLPLGSLTDGISLSGVPLADNLTGGGVAGNDVDTVGAVTGVAENEAMPKPQYGKKKDAKKGGDTLVSAGNDGVLTGNQVYLPIQAPINVCGNGIGILGLGLGQGQCTAVAKR